MATTFFFRKQWLVKNLLWQGELYFHLQKFELARQKFEELLKAHPDHPVALTRMASLLRSTEEYEKAARICEQALTQRLSPQEAFYFLWVLGDSLFALVQKSRSNLSLEERIKHLEECLDAYSRALRLKPQADIALLELVENYRLAISEVPMSYKTEARLNLLKQHTQPRQRQQE